MEHLQPYMEAFVQLSGRRVSGMSVGRIPYSEMEAYMNIYGITGERERARFGKFMDGMDAVFMDWQAKKASKQ